MNFQIIRLSTVWCFRKAVFVVLAAMSAAISFAMDASWRFDDKTGAVSGFAAEDGRAVATGFSNRYFLMVRDQPDVTALESEDVVVSRHDEPNGVRFKCTNPKLPNIEIVKRYSRDNGGLRRTLAFRNGSAKQCYLTPFTECHFDPVFLAGTLYHLGAGYIGPYKPFPREAKERPVNDYKQSSKGLVFIHPDTKLGNFSHYRVKIGDQVVFPWWHSTIGHYREYHDRLWYLPDGYRMGLGTFALAPNQPVAITDQFNAFDGDIFTFFDGIYGNDRDVMRELKSIPSAPAWFDDVMCVGAGGDAEGILPWLVKMTDEGHFLPRHWGTFSWCEYVDRLGLRGVQGGHVTTEEFAAFMESMRSYAPDRIHPSFYSIVISASWFTEIFRKHPEWFRVHDRAGNTDSLFPGVSDNWQTMFNNADCRKHIVEMLVAYAKRLGNIVYYVDESQQTNTIDWDRDQITLDSDSVRFWQLLKRRFHEEGILFWANGSGNPYADLNYMESPDELSPHRWRDWAGVGLGISMMNRLKPGNRTSPLVWKKGNDYVNRVLALGWLPHAYQGNAVNLPILRASYQQGDMHPANVKYTPDWKTDPKVEVESHSMRRVGSRDVVVSFISRAAKPVDLPVELRLDSLGFAPTSRIAIWKLHFDENRCGTDLKRILSDRQLKTNWREKGMIVGARVNDPELVYSGPASGTWRDVIKQLGKDKMEQYLITLAGPLLFAENDLPLAAFYTTQRHAKIAGRKVTLERGADLLFADRELDFDTITANGNAVATRRIRLNGGLVGTLVTLGKGEWKLGWRAFPRKPGNEKVALPVAGEPGESGVPPPKITVHPEILEVKPVNRVRDGVKILRQGIHQTDTITVTLLQTNVPLTCTSVDAEKLHLVAGPSRREFATRYMGTFAGLELEGARQLHLKFAHNYNDDTLGVSRNRFKTSDNAVRSNYYFGGLMVDYSVGGKYCKRVSMATAFYHREFCAHGPKWGRGGRADQILDLGAWIEEPSPRTFSLDLEKFAPTNWDGKVWLSLGTRHFLAGHHLELEILGFNDKTAKDFVTPFVNMDARTMPLPLKSRPLKTKPQSLTKLDASEWRWQNWTKTEPFWALGEGRPKVATTCWFAHDYEYLYVGVEAAEPDKALTECAEAWSNDHIELLIQRSDASVYQAIADGNGKLVFLVNRKRMNPQGIVTHGEIEPGKYWRTFYAIPIDELKVDMQRTPVTLRLEVARERKRQQERSSWSPLDGGFFECRNYGTVILDFNWTK